ncbi:hypothetical protein V8F06_007955 [Rhypophila decipiens]
MSNYLASLILLFSLFFLPFLVPMRTSRAVSVTITKLLFWDSSGPSYPLPKQNILPLVACMLTCLLSHPAEPSAFALHNQIQREKPSAEQQRQIDD